MTDQEKPKVVADDLVVSLEYTLTVDGVVIDSTDDGETLEYLQGHRNIIPGLEKALYGVPVGEDRSVTVSHEEAYGDFDESSVKKISRDEFPESIPLDVGVELEMKEKNGGTVYGTITEVGDSQVTLDFNHPLAGKTLEFDIKVVDLRHPSAEELEHGHVHTPGHSH